MGQPEIIINLPSGFVKNTILQKDNTIYMMRKHGSGKKIDIVYHLKRLMFFMINSTLFISLPIY